MMMIKMCVLLFCIYKNNTDSVNDAGAAVLLVGWLDDDDDLSTSTVCVCVQFFGKFWHFRRYGDYLYHLASLSC